MNVATLGIKVDVSNLSEATAALNELVAAFDKAQAALAPLGMTLHAAPLSGFAVEVDRISELQTNFYRRAVVITDNGPGSGGNEPS